MTLFLVFVAGATLVIAAIQLTVLFMQRDMMERQTALIEKHTELAAAQQQLLANELGKHIEPHVEFSVAAYDLPTKSLQLSVAVRNAGSKTIKGMYAHLIVEKAAGSVSLDRGSVYADAPAADAVYHHFTSFVSEPVFPTRTSPLWRVSITGPEPDREYRIGLKLVTEDGAFPPGADAALFTFTTEGVKNESA